MPPREAIRAISSSLRADTVTSPPPQASSICITDNFNLKIGPGDRKARTLQAKQNIERIGSVWRLSTTPATSCKGLSRASRERPNFTVFVSPTRLTIHCSATVFLFNSSWKGFGKGVSVSLHLTITLSSSLTLRQACRTVVWSRPPKDSPISGRL